jgi:tRNA pseudouridine55 synthase
MTSHDVVQRVRRALGTRAAGHTGTLDPFATGLLVVLLGRATRLARYLEAESKTYVATARLGIQTDTDDLTGRVLAKVELGSRASAAQVLEALARFRGTYRQTPPQFSAKHIGGERSHQKARRGEQVELAEVSVTVHGLELLDYSPPDLTFRAEVSAGTYIRGLARDLGNALGVGAHLTGLRREAIGSLRVEDAVPLDRVEPAVVLPPQRVLGNLPTVNLDQTARQSVIHGRAVPGGGAGGQQGSGAVIALVAGDELVAIARNEGGWLHPTVVLETP